MRPISEYREALERLISEGHWVPTYAPVVAMQAALDELERRRGYARVWKAFEMAADRGLSVSEVLSKALIRAEADRDAARERIAALEGALKFTRPPLGMYCLGCGNSTPRPHTCHAKGCSTPVKPEMLMCLKHWRMVPRNLQRKVWATYRPGQCDDKDPSRNWLTAADAAIAAVALKEQKP